MRRTRPASGTPRWCLGQAPGPTPSTTPSTLSDDYPRHLRGPPGPPSRHLEIAGEEIVGAAAAPLVDAGRDSTDSSAVGVKGREVSLGLGRHGWLNRAQHFCSDDKQDLYRLIVAPEPDRNTRR